jgi:hypothetical protein
MANPIPNPAPAVVDDPKRPYKAIVAVVVAVLVIGIQAALSALGDGVWTTEDTLTTIVAVLGAIAVWATPNPKIPQD